MPSFSARARDDHPKSSSEEAPDFIKNVHYNYGAETVFEAHGFGKLVTLSPNNNGDCLFAMHGACACIVQKVCRRQTTYPSLRAYYEVIISAIPYYYDEGGVYWPHDYFGAMSYWGYDEWNYHEGFRKFVSNPLEVTKTTAYVVDILSAPIPHPATTEKPQSSQALNNATAAIYGKLTLLEGLPAELLDEITSLVPNRTVFALRLTSRTLAHKLPWNERICYKRFTSGISMPHLWIAEPKIYKPFTEYLDGQITDLQRRDWKRLTTLLADSREVVKGNPEQSGVPLGLWNRCRIWECVVSVKKFKRPFV